MWSKFRSLAYIRSEFCLSTHLFAHGKPITKGSPRICATANPNDAMIVTEIFETFSNLNPGLIGNELGEIQFYDGDLEI